MRIAGHCFASEGVTVTQEETNDSSIETKTLREHWDRLLPPIALEPMIVYKTPWDKESTKGA